MYDYVYMHVFKSSGDPHIVRYKVDPDRTFTTGVLDHSKPVWYIIEHSGKITSTCSGYLETVVTYIPPDGGAQEFTVILDHPSFEDAEKLVLDWLRSKRAEMAKYADEYQKEIERIEANRV